MISGPSGVGKGSVVRRLLLRDPEGLVYSVSVSTRPARAGESERDYWFVADAEFDRLVREGALLEWAQVFGHRYGTPAVPVERLLANGRDVILEIDVQGARTVRERAPGALFVFLVPPSREELIRRLRERGTEDEEALAVRLAKADEEMAESSWFDHVVVNDDLEEATTQVEAIILGSRSHD